MKKFIHPLSIILAICMLAMSFAACGTVASADEGVAYVSLRINPEIELVTDEHRGGCRGIHRKGN